jgi:hypothetical protein
MTDLELLQSMSPGSGRIIQSDGTVINIADAFYIEDDVVKLRTSGGGGFTGGVVPNATEFQAEVSITGGGYLITAGPIVAAGATGGVRFYSENLQVIDTASGTVDQASYSHLVDTSSGELTLTVGAPTAPRRTIRFQMIVDGGGGLNDAIITFNGASTVRLTKVGDMVELTHNGAEYLPMLMVNLVDGTIPVYTP